MQIYKVSRTDMQDVSTCMGNPLHSVPPIASQSDAAAAANPPLSKVIYEALDSGCSHVA
jgi:hypothetical protein